MANLNFLLIISLCFDNKKNQFHFLENTHNLLLLAIYNLGVKSNKVKLNHEDYKKVSKQNQIYRSTNLITTKCMWKCHLGYKMSE